jgi:hypothetical protein
MPAYFGTPLAKRLGIVAGAKVVVLRAPFDYAALVAPLPEGATLSARFAAAADLVHLFEERIWSQWGAEVPRQAAPAVASVVERRLTHPAEAKSREPCAALRRELQRVSP